MSDKHIRLIVCIDIPAEGSDVTDVADAYRVLSDVMMTGMKKHSDRGVSWKPQMKPTVQMVLL